LTVDSGKEDTTKSSRPTREAEVKPQAVLEPSRIGELVGNKYRISRFLAEGGMGVVYEAQHEVVRRRFAVKFLRQDYARRREFLGRFQREAEAAGALESENIASAVDFGIAAGGSPFMVMEYLVGEDLAALLEREGRLPLERAADLCVQACHGAEAAHAAGILHRDLKPKNLFIGQREDGTDLLKILDFGIAKLAPIQYDHSITDTGTVMGTPAYMSPEHARGERMLDPRSDVYALGAILFEMLSGHLPHPGDSPNAILHHISTRPAISLATAAPSLPSTLVELVDRTLSTDPGARPQSAKALALGLAAFAKRQVWPAHASRDSTASSVVERAEPAADLGRTRHPGWRRGALVMGAIALAVAAAAAAIVSRPPKTASKSMVKAQSTATEAASADARPTLRPAAAEPVSSSTAVAVPRVPPASDAVGLAPVKPPAAKRTHASGRPSERPVGRPDGKSTASTPVAPAPQPEKGLMPPSRFDRENPYAKP
jgi:serine/threonine-protein kinase